MILILVSAIVITAATVTSCVGRSDPEASSLITTGSDTDEPTQSGLKAGAVIYDENSKNKYYCPDIFTPAAVPCRVNIETGEIQYACPSADCNHSGKQCYYYNKWVRSAVNTGNYLIMNIMEYPSALQYIAAYEWETSTVFTICEAGHLADIILPGVIDGSVYGYRTRLTTKTPAVIDLFTGKITPSKDAKEELTFLFCDRNKVYGLNKNGPIVITYPDMTVEEYTFPAGCEDYELRKPGMLYRTDAPAAIYDINSGVTVYPDPSLDITSPVQSGDRFYYQSRGEVVTGKKADGTDAKYVRYDNVICRQDIDGKTEKFTVDTDYHFIIYAAYGDCAIGRLMYKITDGVYTPFEELDHDHIKIDLKSGEVQLLDLYTEHDYFL